MTGGFRLKAAGGAAVLAVAALLAGAAVAAEAEGYDQKFRDEFMRSCISGGGSYTVCQCTMQRLESAIAFEKFVTMRKAAQSGEKADQKVLDAYGTIVTDCVAVKKE
jgi:hypothetical protein